MADLFDTDTRCLAVALAAAVALCACSGPAPDAIGQGNRQAPVGDRAVADGAEYAEESADGPNVLDRVEVFPPGEPTEPAYGTDDVLATGTDDAPDPRGDADRRDIGRGQREVADVDPRTVAAAPASRPAGPPRPARVRERETVVQAVVDAPGAGRPSIADMSVAPGDARVLNRQAVALINSGQAGRAIPTLERAVAMQPRDVETLGNLGYAYMLAGEYGAARAHLQRALDLSPTRSATWLNLGQTYAEMGQRDAAVDAVLEGYRYSTRKPTVLAALRRAVASDRHSEAWRRTAALALAQIGG